MESFFEEDDLSTFSGRRVAGDTSLLAERCKGCDCPAALRSEGGRTAEPAPEAAAEGGKEGGAVAAASR